MLTKTRASIGLGVISLAATFAYFSKSAEPPVAEPPGPFARYLQEVNQRLEAYNSWGASGAVISDPQDAASLPVTRRPASSAEPTPAFTPLSEQSDIARHAAGFSSPHVGVAAMSYNHVYRALKVKNSDQFAHDTLGMKWETFVAQVDAANAQEQREMSLKVNSLVNME